MKRTMIVLVAMATALAIAAPAAAEKPDRPDKPGRPDDGPLAGVTCFSPWWDGDVKTDDFSFELSADGATEACFDVLTSAAGVWKATVTRVTADARVRSMLIVPRDAYSPGDSCGGQSRRGWDDIEAVWEFPHPDDTRFEEIPAATVNACPGDDPDGIGEFAETVERDLDGDGVVDVTEIVMEATGEVHPLAFLVFTQGLRGSVLVEVDLP